MESLFGLLRDSVSIDARLGHGLRPNVPFAEKLFWTHPMILLDEVNQVEAQYGLFEDSANLDAR
jgi:hypothetical protein